MSRIAALRTYAVNITPKTNWVFLEVTDDDGLTGVGEASLNGWEPLLLAYAELVARSVEGRDDRDIAALACYRPHSPGGLVAHAIHSALEQALTDLNAKRAGQPIHQWLHGSRRERVPVYANINRATRDRSPAGFQATARNAVQSGFRAIKVAPFDGVISQDRATTPFAELIAQGVERIFVLREAVGPDIELMVDCHWRFDEASATQLIRDLAPLRLFWLECPISEHPAQFDAIARLRKLANAHGMRLAGAETITGIDHVQPMLVRGLYDVIMPDLKYCGGYQAMLAIARLASEHVVAFSPHNPTGPICNLGSLHACAAATDCLNLEYQLAESPLYVELVGGVAPRLDNGAFIVPDQPGLGAMLNHATVAAHPWKALPTNANLDPRLG